MNSDADDGHGDARTIRSCCWGLAAHHLCRRCPSPPPSGDEGGEEQGICAAGVLIRGNLSVEVGELTGRGSLTRELLGLAAGFQCGG